MKDGKLLSRQDLLVKPKNFVHEKLEMPDGVKLDWYYVDTPASVLVIPVTTSGSLVLVRQYRQNLRSHVLEFPAGIVNPDETPEQAAHRELKEETGFRIANHSTFRSLGSYYSLPSETNKYTHFFLANPVVSSGAPVLDSEIEKYFDMSVVEMPFNDALEEIGSSINGIEAVGALMLARARYGLGSGSS
jgi:ADP-ribose pyrophosphatase